MYDYIGKKKNICFKGVSFSGRTKMYGTLRGRSLERFVKENVMDLMWDKTVDFINGYPKNAG